MNGFQACKSDAGIYVRRNEGEEPMYVLVCVDDLLITSKDLNMVERKSLFTTWDKLKFSRMPSVERSREQANLNYPHPQDRCTA